MGIQGEENQKAGQLPGGAQRILGITNAMATNPALLMLDEPLAGLNTTEKMHVVDRIKAFPEMGITVLLVEHDMKSIMYTCDRITVMDFGAKIAEGTPKEVSGDQRTIDAYLGKKDCVIA